MTSVTSAIRRNSRVQNAAWAVERGAVRQSAIRLQPHSIAEAEVTSFGVSSPMQKATLLLYTWARVINR